VKGKFHRLFFNNVLDTTNDGIGIIIIAYIDEFFVIKIT